MKDDIFTTERADVGGDGRVVEVGVRPVDVRLVSEFTHSGCHWVEQHVLCGGSRCKVCERGVPKRPYSFCGVQRPDGSWALLRATPRDVATMEQLAQERNETLSPGACFRLSRPKSRQPLAIEWIKRSPSAFTMSRDRLLLEILRLHQIQVTEGDIRTGYWVELVIKRSGDLLSRLGALRCG